MPGEKQGYRSAHSMNRAFLTGSHVYGTPRESSDVDLVVLIDRAELDRLRELLGDDPEHNPYGASCGASIRIGKLNLIAVTSTAEYDRWLCGTKILRMRAPVSRDVAVATFAALRGEAGV